MKVFVKLKDQSGSVFIGSQGISVNRTQIVEVEKDEIVANHILHGGLIEVKESESKEWKEKREKALKAAGQKLVTPVSTIQKDDEEPDEDEGEKEFGIEQAKDLFKKAVAAEKADGTDGKISIGKNKYDGLEAAYKALIDDEKLRNNTIKAITPAEK